MPMKARYTIIDGEVIAEKRGGVRSHYVPDPLGSTVALLDNTQTKTDTFTYWPYGEEATRTGTTGTPFRYVGTVGYYRDSETRTYVRARYLNTGLGRWQTSDPLNIQTTIWKLVNDARHIQELIGFDATKCLYEYVFGNPMSHADRTGLWIIGLDPFPPNDTKTCGLTNRADRDCNCADPALGYDCLGRACCSHDQCIKDPVDIWKFPYCNAMLCSAALKCNCSAYGSSAGCGWVQVQVIIVMCPLSFCAFFGIFCPAIFWGW